jgi:DNA-binding NtrC family response regulator
VPRLLKDLGRDETTVPEATIEALRAHTWPGNVRELKNVLACALAFVESGPPEPRHLRFIAPPSEEASLDRMPLGGHSLMSLERAAIRQTLLSVRGNKVHAAKALGIARRRARS